ncbi:MAG: M23 family metallopeptidase [Bacteroidales bacterium]|nr:M23 family metallopeptidase [Bacteroidales bacterium]MDD3989078.1 M23 family metallopeptidase [Bacteroidales bacterium]MDD4638874.1 M23 family metallopeptidase [Bacteroidales bacterium]
MKKIFTIIFLLFLLNLPGVSHAFSSSSTGDEEFRLPLNLAISLSGNYGELRSTHFHSGLDFRVGGVTGAPVYAAMVGYISRISVSPGGYGHAVYITHPNGRTTVYGHLNNFAPAVAKWVEEMQYSRKSFKVNLFPESSLFPVKRGEIIGNAGNTGSSGGPHLHYEIRESSSQIPLNPVSEADYNIKDKIPPQIRRVNFYSIRNSATLPETTLISSCETLPENVVSVPDTFYIAVDAVDKMEGNVARLAVGNYSYYLNNKLVYSFIPDRIPFDKGKYINSVVEYSEKHRYGRSMVKSFVEPGNGLKEKINYSDQGLFILAKDTVYNLKIEISDISGNITRWNFKVAKQLTGNQELIQPEANRQDICQMKGESQVMAWYLRNKYEDEGVSLTLPPGSLYRTILFTASSEKIDGKDELIWNLGSPEIPIHNHAKLSLSFTSKDVPDEKLYIGRVDDSGKIEYLGGVIKGSIIGTDISSFGKYMVASDTLPPVVVPHFKNNQDLSGRKSMKFTIKDDISGISFTEVLIDGEWILYNYDPKSSSLTVKLVPERLKSGRLHDLVINVRDNRNNITTLKRSFIFNN